MLHKRAIVFGFLLILGLMFRWFLASHATDQIIYDSSAYHEWAIDFLRGKSPLDCCGKNVGYSVFLAFIYRVSGVGNIAGVRFFQSILDVGTAILIFIIARRAFGNRGAWYSFILYLFNPFTASFTGLILSEVLAMFLVALIAVVITDQMFRRRWWLWLVYGVLLGYLLFVRHAQYYWSLLSIPLLLYYVPKERRVAYFVVTTIGFLIASSYTLINTYRDYRVFSFLPVYSQKWQILYLNFYPFRFPEIGYTEHFPYIEPEGVRVTNEYWDTPLEGRIALGEKYRDLFFSRLRGEWPFFISSLFQNTRWMWDKYHLYTYDDPFYPNDALVLRIYNGILLILFAIGFTAFVRRKTNFMSPLALYTLSLLATMLLLFPLVTNETRHSLIFYPLLIMWAGYGGTVLRSKINIPNKYKEH